jgi:hypothetical protein
MEISFATHETKGGDESKEAKYMVSMKMTDKYMVDSPETDAEPTKLDLCTLAAID